MELPRIIELPKIEDYRDNLTFVQNCDQIPFDIARVYWTYDVPGGVVRGSHAHKENESLIVAASGSFDVTLSDGTREYKFSLNRSYRGLYVPVNYWRTLDNFSSGSVCMVLSSKPYSEDDYIRNYDEYLEYMRSVDSTLNG